ncbi:hypothetical protein M758_5G059100 [Ceratodon purpureus]|nr:hypothetical protein M758_5G059100 [Ceratodon purpureus]
MMQLISGSEPTRCQSSSRRCTRPPNHPANERVLYSALPSSSQEPSSRAALLDIGWRSKQHEQDRWRSLNPDLQAHTELSANVQ